MGEGCVFLSVPKEIVTFDWKGRREVLVSEAVKKAKILDVLHKVAKMVVAYLDYYLPECDFDMFQRYSGNPAEVVIRVYVEPPLITIRQLLDDMEK